MNKKIPTVVITGATGFVGSHLVDHFSQQGWHVRALVRNAPTAKKQQHVQYFTYDLSAPPDDSIFRGADYLIHTAYIKEDRQHPQVFDLNVQGTRHLLAASRKHKLKKNIFMSSMSAHKNAVSSYGKQKFAVEKLFNTSNDIVIRSGLVIGNGGLIQKIVHFMRTKHIAPLVDGGDQPLQVIGIYDLVTAIEKLLAQKIYGTFTLGTPEVYSYREFYLTISRKLSIKVFIIPVPFFIPLYAIRLINMLRLPLGVTEDNLWGLKKLQAFETLPDLKKIGLRLDPLETILDKTSVDTPQH